MTCHFMPKLCHAILKHFQQLVKAVRLLIRATWNRLTGRDRGSEEAMQWVITLDSCVDLVSVLPDFHQWLSTRPDNRARFEELWDFWHELNTLKDRNRWREPSLLEGTFRLGSGRKPFPWRESIGVTVIAGTTLIFILYLSRHSTLPCQPTAATNATRCLAGGRHFSGAGQTVRLDLIDGSIITLSERSQVTLDIGRDRRHVRLEQGEAQFEVAKKNRYAFEVSLDDGAVVRAVGTDFSVKKTEPEGARVEVRDGAVDLLIGDQDAVRVKAGEVAEFDTHHIQLNEEDGVWFIFRGESLSDAAREFNRYDAKHAIVVDEDVRGRSVQGRFSAANPGGFANVMAMTWGIKCSISRDSTGTETIHLSNTGGTRRSASHKTRGRASVEEQESRNTSQRMDSPGNGLDGNGRACWDSGLRARKAI